MIKVILYFFILATLLSNAHTVRTKRQDGCKVKDDDVCLQNSPSWKSSYTCATSTGYCSSWAKDMRRCCPISCNSGHFTHVDCLISNGKGACRYPNDAQCSKGLSGKYF